MWEPFAMFEVLYACASKEQRCKNHFLEDPPGFMVSPLILSSPENLSKPLVLVPWQDTINPVWIKFSLNVTCGAEVLERLDLRPLLSLWLGINVQFK